MGGAYARRKGHNFERWVAAKFRAAGFPDAKRGQQTRFGSDAPDVAGTPYWIECKAGKKTNPVAAYKQARLAYRRSSLVVRRSILVVTKNDRCKPMAHVSATSSLVDDVPWLAQGDVTSSQDGSVVLFTVPFLLLLEKLPKEF